MRYIIALFFFLIPLHAFLITTLKCGIWINTNIIRFWKEIVIILLLLYTIFYVLKKYKFKISKIYKNNYILWTITAFSFVSFIYIFFPFNFIYLIDAYNKYWFNLEITKNFISSLNFKSALLWFKYDVFFLFAVLIWFYLPIIKNNIKLYLKSIFASIIIIFIVFIPVFLSNYTQDFYTFFGYSNHVSTYNPNSCITFSQNVEWGHFRFQASFWWPIRFSVFLVVYYLLFLWFSLKYLKTRFKYLIIWIFSILTFISIFYSYSKTWVLGLIVWLSFFSYFFYKYKLWRKIKTKFIIYSSLILSLPILSIIYIKKDLFLHLWAIINRFQNLNIAMQMFIQNPIWYWLWKAWPASQLWKIIDYNYPNNSIFSTQVHKFLPENWYVQILIEQGILGFWLFLWIILMILYYLIKIAKNKKDFLSIWFLSSYIALIFMVNFTHWFEESATSYTLFMLIWAYIAKNIKFKKKS